MTNTQPTIDLHQYWDVLRSRKLAIIVPTLAAIALAAAFIVLQKPQYTAHGQGARQSIAEPGPGRDHGQVECPRHEHRAGNGSFRLGRESGPDHTKGVKYR